MNAALKRADNHFCPNFWPNKMSVQISVVVLANTYVSGLVAENAHTHHLSLESFGVTHQTQNKAGLKLKREA